MSNQNNKLGMSLETAASVLARDMITRHLAQFHHVIRADRLANASTSAAYIDGLAGVMALTVRGGHGSEQDVVDAVVTKLRECVRRDLHHLGVGP